MEVYIFGSYCRGEIDCYSDVDLLVIKEQDEGLPNLDSDKHSIYSNGRIIDLWKEGNPFAWHLHLESKMIFSSNNQSLLQQLGEPRPYKNLKNDLIKFHKLYKEAVDSIKAGCDSLDFDLSMIFLAIRNFASCYALGFLSQFNFSRRSALKLGTDSINISAGVIERLEQSRVFSTRGLGDPVSYTDLDTIRGEFKNIDHWFNKLLNEVFI